ncbi:MAG: chemotaxis protein CheD [Acidobacteria bacterium]|nr:chemotaxis protein CheD [Acidobacteriota bacterium]
MKLNGLGTVVVGAGDCGVSNDPSHLLTTYALGSCIGLAIHDPVAKVSGLLHFMLADSTIDAAKAQANPYMFADTGIPQLFKRAYELGAQKRRLVVSAAGGAQVMDPNGVFNIGKRNYLAMRKILWRAGVLLQTEVIGGTGSRTLRLEVATGKLWMQSPDGEEVELSKAAPSPSPERREPCHSAC